MDEVLSRLGVSRDEIEQFCRKWEIVRLELFGSALRDDFDDKSDVDVLVTFAPGRRRTFREHLAIEDELVALFGRSVDLIERKLIESSPNWIRRKSILGSARLVYEAA